MHRRVDSSHALVSSVEWLSSDVIAAGLKDSAIFLHDLRSGGTATRLQHNHAVVKIKKVDEYRLVVGGLNSVRSSPRIFLSQSEPNPGLTRFQLKMYDIRFPPNGLQRNPNPHNKHHTSTTPYLTFPEYTPDFIPDFDISSELGLLASGKLRVSSNFLSSLPVPRPDTMRTPC